MEPKHSAIAAGLALTLALGSAQVPAVARAETTATQASDSAAAAAAGSSASGDTDAGTSGATGATGATGDTSASASLPAPSSYDKEDFYREDSSAAAASTMSRSSALMPHALSNEMKYFAQNESGSNYNKGFSRGDGYNALGFYQFDRRYALVGFMQGCYSYNPVKYAMFKPVIDRASEVKSGTIYANGSLTELGQLIETAWHAAYATDPVEFAALQDSYAYQNYYLPVESSILDRYGVDISGRADCVKGLCWSLSNLFGASGCHKFFSRANLSNDMTDEEMVTAICDAVIDNVASLYPSQPQYHTGWINRYKREKQTCLNYIAQHEAENDAAGDDAGDVADDAADDAGDAAGDEAADDDAEGSGSAGDVENAGNGDAATDDGGTNGSGDDVAADSTAGDIGQDSGSGADTSDGASGSGTSSDSSSAGGSTSSAPLKKPAASVVTPTGSPTDTTASTDSKDESEDERTEQDEQEDQTEQDNRTEQTDNKQTDEQDTGKSDADSEQDTDSTPQRTGDDTGNDNGSSSSGDNGNGNGGGTKTTGGSGSGNDNGSGASNSNADSNQDAKKEPALPQTSDPSGLTALASAGLSMLGVASTVAGAYGLTREREDSSATLGEEDGE